MYLDPNPLLTALQITRNDGAHTLCFGIKTMILGALDSGCLVAARSERFEVSGEPQQLGAHVWSPVLVLRAPGRAREVRPREAGTGLRQHHPSQPLGRSRI